VSEATAKKEPEAEALPTSSVDVCARAQAQIDSGDARGAQRTLMPIVRSLLDEPLPFRLLGEAFLRSGDAHRAERALAHARALEVAAIDRGDDVVDRGTEAWLHRARSLKKTQSMLGYRAVAEAVAQSAPPAISASGVREKVTEAPLEEEDGVALDMRLNHERRRARALEAQPTRRIEPPSELLDLASPDLADLEPPPSEEPPAPISHASEREIEVLVDRLDEVRSPQPAPVPMLLPIVTMEQIQLQPPPKDRWILALTVGACVLFVLSIVALLAALGIFG
jgi:hypothetical protein